MTQTPDIAAPPARALDPRYYRDPEIHAREMERIFFRTWQYACHESALAKPGDYVAFTIADQGIFAIRSDDGRLRAFYNVCRHRAHELLTGSGNAPVICCPYHAWTYATDGRLRHARNTGKTPGFDIAEICLAEVRLELFHGFVFVNLDADAAPMAGWYPGAAQALGAFLPDIARMKPVSETAIEAPCNWKVTVENYSECYHCAVAHPTFARGVIDPKAYRIEVKGHCLHHSTRAAPSDAMAYDIDDGADPHATDYGSWFLWPSFSFQVYPGGLLNSYLWRPRGPTETTVWRGWYTLDGAPSAVVEALARQDLATTVAEDVALVGAVQRGLASRGYTAGPLVIDPAGGVDSEHAIDAIAGWVRAALADEHLSRNLF